MRAVAIFAAWVGLVGSAGCAAPAVQAENDSSAPPRETAAAGDAAAPTRSANSATAPKVGEAPHPRLRTIEALERAAADRSGWLDVSLAGRSGADSVRVGEQVAFEFGSDRDTNLTVVHVDGEGNLTLLFPGEGGRLVAGQSLLYPSEDPFDVVLPIGSEAVYAFATPRSLGFDQLGVKDEGGYASIDPVVGPEFASCLAGHLDRAGGDVASTRLAYRVLEKDDALPYNTRSIEDYFTTVTRSFQRPTLDLLIHFESGKAELLPSARDRLDEVGRALSGSKLGTYRFTLNGHTDDVGEDGFNLDLSQRRADAAKGYLVSEHDVDPARLEILAHGEASPKVAGMTPTAREQNRRVELELERRTRSIYRCGP
jgi:outer membrane protein OmpA-like peptidoglycan-associated protein